MSSQRLLIAAAELIVEKGWEATTAAEIGRRAGYSRAMVHARYGSKDAILEAFQQTYVVRLNPDPEPGTDGLRQVLAHFDRIQEIHAVDPALMRAMFVSAFEAVKTGEDEHVDTVIVDTAGRLHTKVGLMDELGKVKRVVEKKAPVDEVLLVLDATTGQNGLRQARVFAEVVDVTGIVLTKLDGTAKGGIVIAVQRELGVPVKLVGLGEGPDDLAPFDPSAFVDAILG